MRDAWPEVLGRLERTSRSSWLIASGARVIELDGDVLTLAFQSQPTSRSSSSSRPAPGRAKTCARRSWRARHPREVPRQARQPRRGPAAPPTGVADPLRRPASAPESAPARPAAVGAPRAAAAPVTEWAVASIPTDADAPPADAPEPPTAVAQFAVDDEPEDAADPARRARATLAPPREGDVLPARDVEPSIEPTTTTTEMDAATDAPVPARRRAADAQRCRAARNDGVQRYGEAVVRQVLGARFVREEPYEPPTRFS